MILDVNECTNGQANCATGEVCINTDGGYRCECLPNWRLDRDRQRCMPVWDGERFPPGYKNRPGRFLSGFIYHHFIYHIEYHTTTIIVTGNIHYL